MEYGTILAYSILWLNPSTELESVMGDLLQSRSRIEQEILMEILLFIGYVDATVGTSLQSLVEISLEKIPNLVDVSGKRQ